MWWSFDKSRAALGVSSDAKGEPLFEMVLSLFGAKDPSTNSSCPPEKDILVGEETNSRCSGAIVFVVKGKIFVFQNMARLFLVFEGILEGPQLFRNSMKGKGRKLSSISQSHEKGHER